MEISASALAPVLSLLPHRPADEDAGVRPLFFEIIAQAGFDDDLAEVVRRAGMHEAEDPGISNRQADVRGPVAPAVVSDDADDIAVFQPVLDGGDAAFRDHGERLAAETGFEIGDA